MAPSVRPAGALAAFLALVALAGCAGSLASTVRGPTPLGVTDAFDCARRELEALAYKVSTFDRDAGALTAQKTDPRARRPRTMFVRVTDRIEVKARAGAGGNELEVRGRTWVEFGSQAGPREEEESASDTARSDAGTVLERCTH